MSSRALPPPARAATALRGAEPTMSSVMRRSDSVSGSSSATVRPARMMVTRSAKSRTSRSLWVIRTTAVPRPARPRTTPSSRSASSSVSTAVGSSRIRMRAPDISTLTISTRWRSATEIESMRAPGSSSKPSSPQWRSMDSETRASASVQRPPIGFAIATFSATVNGRTSLKCWCTMPMPSARACAGPATATGAPSTAMRPASGA